MHEAGLTTNEACRKYGLAAFMARKTRGRGELGKRSLKTFSDYLLVAEHVSRFVAHIRAPTWGSAFAALLLEADWETNRVRRFKDRA